MLVATPNDVKQLVVRVLEGVQLRVIYITILTNTYRHKIFNGENKMFQIQEQKFKTFSWGRE